MDRKSAGAAEGEGDEKGRFFTCSRRGGREGGMEGMGKEKPHLGKRGICLPAAPRGGGEGTAAGLGVGRDSAKSPRVRAGERGGWSTDRARDTLGTLQGRPGHTEGTPR